MTDFFKKGIYIFNPDTDFALASGSKFYTPPASVISLSRSLALLPSLYAPSGSVIIIPDDVNTNDLNELTFCETLKRKKISVCTLSNLAEVLNNSNLTDFFPWGWNQAVAFKLLNTGASQTSLPSNEQLEKIRNLSHRNNTIAANTFFHQLGLGGEEIIPVEIKDVADATRFLELYPHAWFKAPWSSSGRGVISAKEMSKQGVIEWVSGTIRRQGSVLAETPADKTMDFATEWICNNNQTDFIGFSVFNTSARGKFKSNLNLNQSQLKELIERSISTPLNRVLELQKSYLNDKIAPNYCGPVGIDMMAESNRSLRPCVEINLRMTMGLVEIAKNNKHYE